MNRNNKGQFSGGERPERKTGKDINCLICGYKFYVPKCYLKRKKFCSKQCRYKSRLGKPSTFKGHKHTEKANELNRIAHIGNKHSIATKLKISKSSCQKTGADSWSWKNGRGIDAKGYIRVYAAGHPNAYSGIYILEHRLVAEKLLGRFLTPTEVIHHINKIKIDNRPENLYLFPSTEEHSSYHRKNEKPLISNLV